MCADSAGDDTFKTNVTSLTECANLAATNNHSFVSYKQVTQVSTTDATPTATTPPPTPPHVAQGVDTVLTACKAWGAHSKQDNGCQAYHSGWPLATNSASDCPAGAGCYGTEITTRAYQACSLTECSDLCVDLYPEIVNQNLCKKGCAKYVELGGCVDASGTSDVLAAPMQYLM